MPVWDQASHQWVLRLTCGSFTFQGVPPLNVTWTTPLGEARFSSGYDSGRFYLHLDTPVQGGNYTCSIPSKHLPDIIDGGDEKPDNVSVDVNVDELKSRLTLAEANQQALRDELEELEQRHAGDMENVTQMCQGIRVTVDEQQEALDNIQEYLEKEKEKEDLSGPCGHDMYTVLDDPWRSTSQRLEDEYSRKCDRDLAHGWYRFYLNGENAVMPTACVPERHCQTHAPMWLDLRGQPLPGLGQETDGRACANWDSDCCNWESPITVRNCGKFYVYKLQPRQTCSLAYCAEPQQ